MKKYKKRKKFSLYTVYDNRTDFPICVCECARKCAETMGVKIDTFYHNIVGRKVNGNRWFIIREEQFDHPTEKGGVQE